MKRSLFFIPILLLSFGLRAAQLGAQSLWYDETFSVIVAQKPIPELITQAGTDIHPPLYYVLLHYWVALAGSSEFSVRWLSLFFGVLLVALAFNLAHRWFGLSVAILSALLIGISSFNLGYAQEARMYTLTAFEVLLSLVLLIRMQDTQFSLNSRTQQITAIIYVLTLAFGLYTHYYNLFTWLCEYLWVFAYLSLRWLAARPATRPPLERSVLRDLLKWHVLQVLVLALFVPWLPILLRQVVSPPVPPWLRPVDLPFALRDTLERLTVGQNASPELLPPVFLSLSFVYALALLRNLSRLRPGARADAGGERYRVWFLAASTFGPFGMILLGSLFQPLYNARFMFSYSAAFYMVLALAFDYARRYSHLLLLLLFAIYALGAIDAEFHRRFDDEFTKDDFRRAVGFLATRIRPGDAVLIDAGFIYPAFVYYYPGPVAWRGRLSEYAGREDRADLVVAQTGSLQGLPSLGWASPTADYYLTDEPTTFHALDTLLSRHTRLWVLRSQDRVTDPDGVVRRYLDMHAVQFDELSVNGNHFIRVLGFLSRTLPPALPEPAATAISMGDQVSLVGWTTTPAVMAGSTLKVSFYWKALTPLTANYRFSVGLYDERGRRWAQTDGPLVGPLLPSSQWAPGQVLPAAWEVGVPVGTPPAQYELQLMVYDPETQKNLPVRGGVEGTRARLGRVGVQRLVEPAASVLWDYLPFQSVAVFDGAMALKSFSPLSQQARPGDTIQTDLLWRALADQKTVALVSLQLADSSGRVVAEKESLPVNGQYPMTQWRAGESVLDPQALLLPANLLDGRYHLLLRLNSASDHSPVRLRALGLPLSGDTLELGPVEVRGRPHVMQPPAGISTPVQARFGAVAQLVGYDLALPQPGGSGKLVLTLYWQAGAPLDRDYKVFVHLVGPGEQISAQDDSQPGEGALPTTSWVTGEYLVDRHVIDLISPVVLGSYDLEWGIYDPRSGERILVLDDSGNPVGDHWTLHGITIR